MRIAVVQKCPSKINYETLLGLGEVEVLNLCEEKITKLLKKDVTLDTDLSEYDWAILVGSEALKMYSKITAITDYTGKKVPRKGPGPDNLIAMVNPSMMIFKPEIKPIVDASVADIYKIVNNIDQDSDIERDYDYFTESEDLQAYLEYLLSLEDLEIFALDTETDAFAPRDGELLGLSITHRVNQGIYAHADAICHTCIELLQKLLDKIDCVLHNAKFDMHFLSYYLGLKFREGHVHDTMIIHYLLDERQGTHGLKPLTLKYGTLGDYERELDEFKVDYCKKHSMKQEDFHYGLIPWDILKIYAAKDTDATLALFLKFFPVLQNNEKLYNCYTNLMLPALHFLFEMEDNGVPISEERLKVAKNLLSEEVLELKQKLHSFEEIKELELQTGVAFNANSTVQIRKLLFDIIGLEPTGKLTKAGNISTDAEVMLELSEQHPIPNLIVNIKQKEKLINTYIDKLLLSIDRDKRVRTSFNQCTTTSGRLSSSGKFNMQQLPRDNPIIKGCVKAPEGYKIVALD